MINEFKTEKELDGFRIEYLGKKGLLNDLFSAFKKIPSDQKKDFGAQIWADTVTAIKNNTSNCTIEILTPDFRAFKPL